MNDLASCCYPAGVIIVNMICVYLTFSLSGVDGVICKLGYGYPDNCPRLEDPPHYTRCCRHLYSSKCCEERSGHVCSRYRSGWNIDVSSSTPAIFCPQPGQSDDMTVCSETTRNRRITLSCSSAKTMAGIFGGVFGGLILIGAILSTVCCYMIKTRRWHCLTYRNGHSIRKKLVCSPPTEEPEIAGPYSVSTGPAASGPAVTYTYGAPAAMEPYVGQTFSAPDAGGPLEKKDRNWYEKQ